MSSSLVQQDIHEADTVTCSVLFQAALLDIRNVIILIFIDIWIHIALMYLFKHNVWYCQYRNKFYDLEKN